MTEKNYRDTTLKNYPKVAIVIPSYNAARTIGSAIEGCMLQDYPRDKLEIIVVDDGSTDETRDIVTRYPVRYIYQPNAGPAKARNTGWKNSKAEIICVMDSDCIPEKRWVAKVVNDYQKKNPDCVGSRYGIANPENLLADCIYCEFLVRYSWMSEYPKFIGSHGCSFKRSVLEELGGYNESYPMASAEDNDLAYRILGKNRKILFDKDIVIKHYFPTSWRKYLRVQFWHGYWRMKLYRDFPRMMRGDEYSTPLDFIQPPLLLSSLMLLPFVAVGPILVIEGIIICLGILLQIPITVGIIQIKKDIRYMLYIPLGFIRALFRGLGMALGISHFWLLPKRWHMKTKKYT